MRLFDCIIASKRLAAGELLDPWRVHEREGKKGGERRPIPTPSRFMTNCRHWLTA